jgi:Ca2+-binding EF-hand superfamily protein
MLNRGSDLIWMLGFVAALWNLQLVSSSRVVAQQPPAAVAARPPDDSRRTSDDFHAVLVFAPGRPQLLGLRARVDGVGLRATRREFARGLLRQHDASGDEQLSQQEAAGVPPLVKPDGVSRPYTLVDTWASVDLAPPDDKISLAELVDYLDRTWGSLLSISVRAPRATPTVDLFALLDTDRDARLTETELTAASTRLSLLDLNDDELITLDELVTPGLSPRDGASLRSPLVSLETADQRSDALARLLDEYGSGTGAGEREVEVEKLSLIPTDLERFDLNCNGRLDRAELRNWLENGEAQNLLGLEFFRTKRGKSQFRLIENASAGPREQPAGSHSRIHWDLNGLELEFRVAPARGTATDNRTFFLQKFAQADDDKNRTLGSQEFTALASGLAQAGLSSLTFEVVDRNQDGEISEQEFADILQQDTTAHQSRIELVLTHQGDSLFDMLGGAGDRRLSARDLKATRDFLTRVDSDRDGTIHPTDLIGKYRISAELGQSAIFRNSTSGGMRGGMTNRSMGSPDGTPGSGPAWFQKMDLNRDGDVSKREFLGPLSAFRRLDRDGDELLSPAEVKELEPDERGPAEAPRSDKIPALDCSR